MCSACWFDAKWVAKGKREVTGASLIMRYSWEAQTAQRQKYPVKPISLDGHHGLYVEMRVPRTVDVDRCDDVYYMFGEGKPGDAQHSSPLVQTLCGRLTGMRPEHAGQKAVCHHHSASSLDSMLRRLVRAHSSQ